MEVEGASKVGFTFGIGLGAGSERPMANGTSRHTWQDLGEEVPVGLPRMTF